MTDAPDHKTFDIRDGLTGISYPEDTVTVYQDAKTGYLIKATNDEISRLRANKETEKARELENQVNDYVKTIESTALKFLIRALPKDVRNGLVKDALERYPEETDFLGRIVSNRDRDEYFTNRSWAAHIVSVETAGGTDVDVDVEKVAIVRISLPDHSLQQIQDGIDGLYQGQAAGFEQARQETSFSSAA